jgi:hypothetical membrane protein
MTERVAGAAGVAAFVVFWTALFVFPASYPGYTHSHKAISELGAFGAPHASAWNLIGFIAPGVLLAICGAGLATSIEGPGRNTAGYWLLITSGVGFAGAGLIPTEMREGSPLMQSPFTIGHVLMTLVSGIPWVIAAFLLIGQVKQNRAWARSRRIVMLLAMACVAGLAVNILAPAVPVLAQRPGVAQRISFGIYFAWFLIMAVQLLAVARRPQPVSGTA